MTIRREWFVELVAPCDINEASLTRWFDRLTMNGKCIIVLPGTISYRRKGSVQFSQRSPLTPAFPGIRGGLLLLNNRNVVANDGGEVLPHIVVAGHRGLGLAGSVGGPGHYLVLPWFVGIPQV